MFKITTTLQKWGNSQGVRLPKEILKAAYFKENETVEISVDETGIRIQKAQKIQTLADLFKDYNGDYTCTEWDTGTPIGEEVL